MFHSKNKIIGVGIGLLLLVGAALHGTPQTPRAEVQGAQTQVEAPTLTTIPTFTPEPTPTDTPVPTATPYIAPTQAYVPAVQSNPSGASAICADGSYSYSLHHQGTCSHHGGVAQWL